MNNYFSNGTPNPYGSQVPIYEPIMDEVKSYPLFYVTEFILPVILLIPTVINFSRLNSYSLYDYYRTNENPNSLRVWSYICLVLFLITLIMAIIDCVGIAMRKLQLTSARLIGRSGITNMNGLNDMLSNIKDISVSHGMLGKVFGYGTIKIQTQFHKHRFKNMKDPDRFVNSVRNTMSGNINLSNNNSSSL